MELNCYIDHTHLKPFATEKDILKKCDEAKVYHFASVCVNPCNVAIAARALADSDVHVCSVIGFPFGTHTTAIKVAETVKAIEDGADEIDMVINIGKLIEGNVDYVCNEVATLTDTCHSKGKLLKVIIETGYLNEKQIATMCQIVSNTGADFIKTSTGYGPRGANFEDIKLFKKYLAPNVKIKAAGGIRTMADALKFVELGCSRIGTSNGIPMVKNN